MSSTDNTSFEKPWQFVVFGDSRSSGENNGVCVEILSELVEEVLVKDVELVLITGDLVVGSSDQKKLQSQLSTWVDVMKPVYQAGINVYPIRGNHDTGGAKVSSEAAAWNTIFSGLYALPYNGPEDEKNLTYSVTHKNAFIIGLDQYGKKKHTVNQSWLDEQLAGNNKPHIFTFGHVPAFEVRHADCLDDHPEERDVFIESLEKAGARMYFCGHDHLYNHTKANDDGNPDNDVHQIIVGTAGAPLRHYSGQNGKYKVTNVNHSTEYGYVLVTVNDLNVTMIWMQRISPGKYTPAEVWSYTAEGKVLLE